MDGAVRPLGELAGQVPVRGVLDLPLDDVPEDLTRTGQSSCAEGHPERLLPPPQHSWLGAAANSWIWPHLAAPGAEQLQGREQGQQQEPAELCRAQLRAGGASLMAQQRHHGLGADAPAPNPTGH